MTNDDQDKDTEQHDIEELLLAWASREGFAPGHGCYVEDLPDLEALQPLWRLVAPTMFAPWRDCENNLVLTCGPLSAARATVALEALDQAGVPFHVGYVELAGGLALLVFSKDRRFDYLTSTLRWSITPAGVAT